MFSLQLPTLSIIFLATSLIPILFLLTFYRRRITCINNFIKQNKNTPPSNFPAVSVIIYSSNDSENLIHILNDVFAQKYPTDFEVIVVNDGASEATKDIVNEFNQRYSNLYITYTPDEARYLSRKKLSLTIGIKAAKYDYIILTNSSCRIHSPFWLESISQHFADGKDVVIGYASYIPNADTQHGARTRAFNSIVDAAMYLSAAIKGKPYRGIDANIAYSRNIFFRNKGFSHSLNLHHGDDDIFISEIATKENTAVELSNEAFVERIYRRSPKYVYRENKSIRNFTIKHIHHHPQLFFGTSSFMMWLWLSLSIASILTSLPNLLTSCIVVLLSILLWLPLMFAWRKASIALHSRKLLLTIPFQLLYRPIHNTIHRLRSLNSRKWNYTWQKR